MNQGMGGNSQTALGKYSTAKSNSHETPFVLILIAELVGLNRSHQLKSRCGLKSGNTWQRLKKYFKNLTRYLKMFFIGTGLAQQLYFIWNDHMQLDGKGSMLKNILGKKDRLSSTNGFSDFSVKYLLPVTVVMLAEAILISKAGFPTRLHLPCGM